MKFTITAATVDHLQYLKDTGAFPDIPREDLNSIFLSHGAAFAVKTSTDHAICAGGVIPMWVGVGMLWLALDEQMRHYPILLIESSKLVIEKMQYAGHFHRLEMYISSESERDAKFAGLLGFTYEGKLHKHRADGGNHLMFAKIY